MSASGDGGAYETTRNLFFLGGSLLIAFLTLMAAIATFNGVSSGGPFVSSFLDALLNVGILGFDGPARVFILMGGLLVVSWGVDLWSGLDSDRDLSIGAPFWIGLGIVALVLFNYVFPEWVMETFGFLGLVEFVTGTPLEDINTPRTAVLGATFMAIFWIVKARLSAAIPQVSTAYSATTPDGLVYAAGQGFISLVRSYRAVLLRIAGAVGTIAALTVSGVSEALADAIGTALGGAFDAIFSSPGWGGYVMSGLAYYANGFVEWIPFTLTTTELGVFLVAVFVFAVGVQFSSNVDN